MSFHFGRNKVDNLELGLGTIPHGLFQRYLLLLKLTGGDEGRRSLKMPGQSTKEPGTK